MQIERGGKAKTNSLTNSPHAHLDQQKPEIHHALHKEVYQRGHLSKLKTLPVINLAGLS